MEDCLDLVGFIIDLSENTRQPTQALLHCLVKRQLEAAIPGCSSTELGEAEVDKRIVPKGWR